MSLLEFCCVLLEGVVVGLYEFVFDGEELVVLVSGVVIKLDFELNVVRIWNILFRLVFGSLLIMVDVYLEFECWYG